MYHDSYKRARKLVWLRRLAVVCVLALLVFAGDRWRRGEEDLSDQTAFAVRQVVIDAAVQCYALEGAYPSELSYLEENYGLQLNHQRFIITYEAFAENLLPEVAVLEKK